MRNVLRVILLLCLIPFWLRAQVTPQPADSIARLSLTARYTGKEVRLRWAPGRPGTWVLLNRTGYVLERYDVGSRGERMNRVVLSVTPVKPEPLANWKRFTTPGNENDYALIAAQAIYGKKFTGNKSSLTQQADELTNRHSFTLLSADLDFETARAAGLGFSDSTARSGKTYYYKLASAAKLMGYMPVDTVFELINTFEVTDIPKPVLGFTSEKEQQIVLSWDKEIHTPKFTAYYMERSADGKTFTRLNRKPYINMASDIENSSVFTFSDSVGNYIPYHYRLIGITSFGDESPPSESVRAMGRDRTPPAQPTALVATPQKEGTVKIAWEATDSQDLAGFYVGRSTDPLVGFKPLFEKPLPASTRSYVDQNPMKGVVNYYLIIAADTANNATASLSVFSAIADSIPPSPPTGLNAKIDTAGILTLRWKANKESDLKGYVVAYANQRDHDFTTAVKEAIPDTVFTDTLRLWTLTEKIYYQVKAVDKNDNTSQASAILEISKPDIVPPGNAVFKDVKVSAAGVALEWIPSSSSDVVRHVLRRKESSMVGFEDIMSFAKNNKPAFTDTAARSGKEYDYQLVAIDDAGLKSQKPPVLKVKMPDFQGEPGAAGLTAIYNGTSKQVEVSWTAPSGSKGATIYRAQDGGVFQSIGSVKGNTGKYTDKHVEPGVSYQYTSRIYYADGQSSAFTQPVKLSF